MKKKFIFLALFCVIFANDDLIIKFPNDVKNLQKIKILYLDENGKEKEKNIDLNLSVKLGDEFLFKKRESPKISKSFDVSVTQSNEINEKKPVEIELDLPFKTQNFGENFSINFSKNKINVITNLKILKTYKLEKFNKFVVDINKTGTSFDENFAFENTIFDHILLEEHKNFDRILVISKDKDLNFKRLQNGFEIGL